MSKTTENTALAVQNNSGYAALANVNFSAMLGDELDGLDLSFERVKIPSGGGTVFELPTEGDDTEMVKEFSAVILYHHPLNAYYETKYSGGNSPPTCGSFDGKIGKGMPGGTCASCPYNQYGTGENGSKACKNKRRVYILREGEVFPLLLTLPTGSLKSFTKYLKTQLSKGRTSSEIVTRFALKKATNTGGIAYSQATFTFDRALAPEESLLVKPLSEQIRTYASNVGFDNVVSDEDTINVDPETGEVIEPLGGNRV
ncbi:hypothetical protein FACS189499_10200 [Clostridia bacterium]|nr:hypothetical protein FACS189499_10200 [Clostridia bacterium]